MGYITPKNLVTTPPNTIQQPLKNTPEYPPPPQQILQQYQQFHKVFLVFFSPVFWSGDGIALCSFILLFEWPCID